MPLTSARGASTCSTANCDKVGCTGRSPQETWLRGDLAANPRQCVAAIWHQPLYSSAYGTINSVRPFWQALYDYHADLIINGHSHNYERFAQMDPTGALAPGRGLKEFVVGTGGASHYAFSLRRCQQRDRATVTSA